MRAFRTAVVFVRATARPVIAAIGEQVRRPVRWLDRLLDEKDRIRMQQLRAAGLGPTLVDDLIRQEGVADKIVKRQESALELQTVRDGLEVTFYIAWGVLEVYRDVRRLDDGVEVSDWEPYGGLGDPPEREVQDFTKALTFALRGLADRPLRMSEDRKTVEYFDGEWIHLCGHFRDGMRGWWQED